MPISFQGLPGGLEHAPLETLPVPGFPERTACAGSMRRVDELREMKLLDDLVGEAKKAGGNRVVVEG